MNHGPNARPNPPAHIVVEILRLAFESRGAPDEARVSAYLVCAHCGQLEWRGSRPCKDGEPARYEDARDAWNGDHVCGQCQDFARRFPDVYVWLATALAFQRWIAEHPPDPDEQSTNAVDDPPPAAP